MLTLYYVLCVYFRTTHSWITFIQYNLLHYAKQLVTNLN